MSGFQLGIDRLLKEPDLAKALKGRKLALLANQASMTSDFQHAIDALACRPTDFQLSAAFGPQHGIRGEKQDNMQETEDFYDPHWKIPVFSLYSQNRRPTDEMMSTFDVLLVDLQDIGTRVYTFLTSLLYVLEACAKHKKEIWVLDRPNPAGVDVEGFLLEKGWVSFVGCLEGMPMRHSLTLGEAALFFKSQLKLEVSMKILEMKGYEPAKGPGFGWPDSMVWVNPSPNASNLSMVRSFPGTVMIEGTHLSEGRGTTRPLETVGAPGLNMGEILKEMQRMAPQWMEGALIRPCNFLPTFQKHAGQICAGFQVHAEGSKYHPHKYKPWRLISLWLKALLKVHPDFVVFRDFHYEYEKDRLAFDLINGGPRLRQWIEDPKAPAGDLESALKRDELRWIETAKPFFIYPRQ